MAAFFSSVAKIGSKSVTYCCCTVGFSFQTLSPLLFRKLAFKGFLTRRNQFLSLPFFEEEKKGKRKKSGPRKHLCGTIFPDSHASRAYLNAAGQRHPTSILVETLLLGNAFEKREKKMNSFAATIAAGLCLLLAVGLARADLEACLADNPDLAARLNKAAGQCHGDPAEIEGDDDVGTVQRMSRNGEEECPSAEAILDRLQGRSEADVCALQAIGWMEEDQSLNEEKMDADLALLPPVVRDHLTRENVVECAKAELGKVMERPGVAACAAQLSEEERQEVMGMVMFNKAIGCLKHQFMNACNSVSSA